MQLSHVEGSDLAMVELQLRRPGGTTVPAETGRKGVLVRSATGDEAMGLAVYHVNDGRFIVATLRVRAFDLNVGRLLVQGLKGVASKNGNPSFWMVAEEEPRARELLNDSGLKLLGFFRVDQADARSPRMGYWKVDGA